MKHKLLNKLLVLTILILGGVFLSPAWAQTYKKVTSAPSNWAGEYLIVYEKSGEGYVWTGVDATSCYVTATISNGAITKPNGAVSVTIASMTGGYSIKVNGGDNNGKYIQNNGNNNGIKFVASGVATTFTYENSSVTITCGGKNFRYNSNSDQKRFRYFGSAQQVVQLYKIAYTVTYNANGGTGTMTDTSSPYFSGTTVTVKSNGFTRDGYTFTGWNTKADGSGTSYAAGATFDISANTTLYAQWVSAGVYISSAPTSTDIEVAGDVAEFELSTNIADPSYAIKYYTTADGDVEASKPEWLGEVEFSGNTLDIAVNENTGAARTAYFKVYSGETYSDVITINQAAYVPVTSVSLDITSKTLLVDGTVTLGATVNPDNASYKTVTWESDDTDVATVNSSGKVTAVAAGTATITAKSTDDPTKKATCTITVTDGSINLDETGEIEITSFPSFSGSGYQSSNPYTIGDYDWVATNCMLSSSYLQMKASVGELTSPTIKSTKGFTVTVTVPTNSVTVSDGTSSASTSEGVATLSTTKTSTTITIAAGSAYAQVSKIKITPLKDPVATEVSITDPGTLAKDAIGTFAYTATTEEENTASWSSATTSVITITNSATGAYTAAGRGTSKITLTLTPTDATTYRSVTAERTVTVMTPVEVSASNIEMTYGDAVAIGATTSDGYAGTLTYESGNTSVATVDASGNVTAVSAGKTTITISAPADAAHFYSAGDDVVINVTVTAPIAVTGVELNKTSTTLLLGGTETLEATVSPNDATNKNVTWSSSDGTKVSVDENGVITALALTNGTPVNITVTTEDGSKTAVCAVTVNPIAVTGVSLKSSTTIEKTKTETLTPTFTPTNATDKSVSWESDDTDVATVSDAGVVTGVAAGTANITVTTNDGGYTATCIVTVVNKKGSIDAPYSVEDIEGQESSTDFGNDIYVTGYIVGSIKDNKCYKTTTTNLVNTNLLLADEPNISFTEGASINSNTDGLIPIELPNNGTIRSDWGIDTNNYLIGYKIILKGNAQSYFSTKGIKGTSEITAVAVPTAVSTSSYATFAANAALDFTDSNIKAYIAEANSTTGITFTQVNKVPANTGVLLYKDGGATEEIPVTTESTDDVANNIFVRGTGATVASVDSENKDLHNYILNKVSGVVGFYRANDKVVAKNRAYIQIDESKVGSSLAKDFFSMPGFDDGPTGVNDVIGKTEDGRCEIYNLAGQRINKLQKGINIINGKKILK